MRDEQKAFTRNRLIDAAFEVFKDQGFDRTTVDDIVAAAGASRATFYLHFKNMLELAEALVDRNRPDVETFFGELDEIQDTADLKALRLWVERQLAWFAENEAVLLAFDRILLSSSEAATAISGHVSYTEHMPRYLSRWPPSRHDEAELRVWMLVALVGRVHLAGRVGRQTAWVDDALLIDVLVDSWAKGLCVGEPIPRKRSARRG